jgi:hypothetical protein
VREPISRLLSHWLYWRQFSDDELAIWGAWRERMRIARRCLVDFLRASDIACQTDNVTARMLLWPDARVPQDGFIDPRSNRELVADAVAKLRDFDFVDYVENSDFVRNVSDWIGAPLTFERLNGTRRAYEKFPVELERELTPEAYYLLEARTRLDLVLWREVVERRSPNEDSGALRARILQATIERYKSLQAGG